MVNAFFGKAPIQLKIDCVQEVLGCELEDHVIADELALPVRGSHVCVESRRSVEYLIPVGLQDAEGMSPLLKSVLPIRLMASWIDRATRALAFALTISLFPLCRYLPYLCVVWALSELPSSYRALYG